MYNKIKTRVLNMTKATLEPNPYEDKLQEIKKHSISLNVKAGDLVRLNKETVVPQYREGKKDEPYINMIDYFTSLSSPYAEFVVVSCSNVIRFKECVAEVIKENYCDPHPCYTHPCIKKE